MYQNETFGKFIRELIRFLSRQTDEHSPFDSEGSKDVETQISLAEIIENIYNNVNNVWNKQIVLDATGL